MPWAGSPERSPVAARQLSPRFADGRADIQRWSVTAALQGAECRLDRRGDVLRRSGSLEFERRADVDRDAGAIRLRPEAAKTGRGRTVMLEGELAELIERRWQSRLFEKGGNVHVPLGKVSFALEALESNFTAFMDQIIRSKPSAAKGVYVRSVGISSTMGPGVKIDPATVDNTEEEQA